MADSAGTIERIKQTLDIVDEIGAVVALRKSGKAFKGLCPFHGERTPSFYVFPETGTWRCFGCNEGGDLFTFVEKQQGLDFREALQLLAERAGVPLEDPHGAARGEEAAESAARRRLRELMEAAAIWFHHQLLQAPEARYARDYLESRGVDNESIAVWRLGYAPEGDRIAAYLREQGYAAAELVEAGLAREREAQRGGGLYDYFRHRLIFPIRDARGRTVAFGGRELGGGTPKYLNTPQTPLFDKSATLYGLDLARDAIKRADRVVIVEGYVDAVVTHQHGFRNVVACIGSAITEQHVRQLKKLTRRVALALDPDAAGESATLRGIAVARQAFDRVAVPVPGPAPVSRAVHGAARRGEPRGVVRFEEQVDAEITIVRLPPGEDPDELVRRDAAAWRQAVEGALPLMDYLFEVQLADLPLDTPAGKAAAAERVLPLIAELGDRGGQDAYVRRLASRLYLDERELALDFQRVRRLHARDAQRDGRREAHREAGRNSSVAPSGPAVTAPDTAASEAGGVGEKYRGAGDEAPDAAAAGYSAPGAAPAGLAARLLAARAQEEYCLGLLLQRPAAWPEVRAIVSDLDFTDTEMREAFRAYAAAMRHPAPAAAPDPLDVLPAVLRTAGERALARVALGVPEEGTGLAKVASSAAYRLKRTRLREEMAELDHLERDAEQSGDREALRSFLGRKQQLLSQRRAIDAAASVYG